MALTTRQTDAGPSRSAHRDTESQATLASTQAYDRRCGGERREPPHNREPVSGRFHPYLTSPAISYAFLPFTGRPIVSFDLVPRCPRIQPNQASDGPRSGSSGTGVDGVPAPSLRRVGNHRFCSRDSVESFFHDQNLDTSPLTPHDHVRAWMTPDVTFPRFTALFGGHPRHERPRSVPRNILCLNRKSQPYAPISPGETGLLLVIPNTTLLEDNYNAFHIFVHMSPPSTPNV